MNLYQLTMTISVSMSTITKLKSWILAIILFIVCAIMTAYELHINAMTARIYRPKSSYKVLCDASIPYLSYFADFIIALTTFGSCSAYLIIISLLWPDIIRYFSENEQVECYIYNHWN